MDRDQLLKEYNKRRRLKINSQKFRNWVEEKTNGEFEVIGQYQGYYQNIDIKHLKCGHVNHVKPVLFKRNPTCAWCKGNHKRTRQEFMEELKRKLNDEYSLIGDYVNTDTLTKFRHNKCGFIFTARPKSILSMETGCPKCAESHGERTIKLVLDHQGIKYNCPKIFKDLYDQSPLHYDFYIPSKRVLIEYQGQQHYVAVDYFGGEVKFKKQQKHGRQLS